MRRSRVRGWRNGAIAAKHFAMDSDMSQTSASATVAFIDLAGFSAIADVYGDASALAISRFSKAWCARR